MTLFKKEKAMGQNLSHFIKTLRDRHGVDFEGLWRDSMAVKDGQSRKRAFDDNAEIRFWETYSEQYDQILSLYDYAPQVLDRIVSLAGKNKTMIEIGCGTGKFTIPMMGFAKTIIALDFSPDMLKRFKAKIAGSDSDKLTIKHGKWESIIIPPAECIYCINSLYRMSSIKHALIKMNRLATEKVVLIWTMQRSNYDAVINKFHRKGIERKQEYIHLMVLLYELGIDADLEFLDVVKPVELEANRVAGDLNRLATKYHLPLEALKRAFNGQSVKAGNLLRFDIRLKVACIHWSPSSNLHG